MGTQPPLPKWGQSPTQFSAHIYCGQTAAWIKMTIGTMWTQLSPEKAHPSPPNFWPMSIVTKWLDG